MNSENSGRALPSCLRMEYLLGKGQEEGSHTSNALLTRELRVSTLRIALFKKRATLPDQIATKRYNAMDADAVATMQLADAGRLIAETAKDAKILDKELATMDDLAKWLCLPIEKISWLLSPSTGRCSTVTPEFLDKRLGILEDSKHFS